MAASPGSWGWWDASWNPVGGCKAVSPGCRNCYAAKWATAPHPAPTIHDDVVDFVRGKPVFNDTLTALPPEHVGWNWPLTWPGQEHPLLGDGEPNLLVVGLMADVFHENRPVEIIDQVVATVVASKHFGLFITKRAERMAEYFTAPLPEKTLERRKEKLWLGFSAERQQEFDERWEHMRALAAMGFIVFVSVAPMLGPVVLPPNFIEYKDRIWCICSGEESIGHGYHDMDPDWARALLAQCRQAGVPFFMLRMAGLQMAGRKPIPADLFVREFPRRM